VTEKNPDHTRPGLPEWGHSLPVSNHTHQFSEKSVSWEHRVGTGHGVAARQETVLFMWGKKTMKEKTTLPKGEDDLIALYIVE
jgi:hypothetical protein